MLKYCRPEIYIYIYVELMRKIFCNSFPQFRVLYVFESFSTGDRLNFAITQNLNSNLTREQISNNRLLDRRNITENITKK